MAVCGKCRSQQVCNCTFISACVEDTLLGVSVILTDTDVDSITTPDSVITSLTGDLDIRVKLAAIDYTPAGGTQTLVAKWVNGGSQRSYRFDLLAGGQLSISTSPTGLAGAIVTGSSTVSTGFIDGTTHWVRGNLDVNDGSGNRQYRFYTSNDGVNWTQLGTTVTVAGATTVFDSATSSLEIGAVNIGNLDKFTGKIYYAEIRQGPNITTAASSNDYDGAIVAVFDPSRAIVTGLQSPTTVDSPTGETWTLSGAEWNWETGTPAASCATLTGNGRTYAPYNYRPNNVPLPRPYGHIRRADSDQIIAAGGSTPIIFEYDDTRDFPAGDFFSGGMTDIVAQPTRLTAPVDGYYLIGGTFSYEDGIARLEFVKNGNLVITVHTGNTDPGTISAMTITALAAGDYITMNANNPSAGPIVVLVNMLPNPFLGVSATHPQLWAQWVRPL